MDLSFGSEYDSFRDEVKTFLKNNQDKAPKGSARIQDAEAAQQLLDWQKLLIENGYTCRTIPKEYGGYGAEPNIIQSRIIAEEFALAKVSQGLGGQGISMLTPTLLEMGTEEQRKEFIRPTIHGEISWCQGYSEPGAGSDLASLRTKAEKIGDHYVVNGHKIWTTLAQFADWMFCLVRTNSDGKPQEGISFLLIDMKSEGIEVKPIITMDGGHEVNEVFLEDVKVPVENLVGEENMGWTIAKYLLGNERTGIAGVARSKKAIERLKEIAGSEYIDGKNLINDSDFVRKISELEVDLTALEYTELRTLAKESKGEGAGAESSILKIKGTEIQQRITELTVEAIGHYSNPYLVPAFERQGSNYLTIGPDYSHGAAQNYFSTRKTSIYGGSNEIQKNIIAKMVLGL